MVPRVPEYALFAVRRAEEDQLPLRNGECMGVAASSSPSDTCAASSMSTNGAVKPRFVDSDPGSATMRLPFLSSSVVAESLMLSPRLAKQAVETADLPQELC